MWGWGGYWGFPWPAIFFGVFFLVILLVWLLAGRRYWHRWERREYRSSGEDILAERFARGELSEKDYDDRLAVLRKRR